MPKLSGKLGVWEVPYLHHWKDRGDAYKSEARQLLRPGMKIATIGSCFAEELAKGMERFGLAGAMHPGGLFYTPRCIRQEFERMFGGSTLLADEPIWRTATGFVNPIRNHHQSYPAVDGVRSAVATLNQNADRLFKDADLIVVTLGLIESWSNPKTGVHFNQIPHPDVFKTLGAEFSRLTVSEIREDLEVILKLIQANTRAQLIVTVSPVPLHSTMTNLDIRVANAESKGRLRSAVSEFVEAHPEVSYFHSYEIVACAERQSDFMLEDGRHVSRVGVDYILAGFVNQFRTPEVPAPPIDGSFLTRPDKTATRIAEPPAKKIKRALRTAAQKLWMNPLFDRVRGQ